MVAVRSAQVSGEKSQQPLAVPHQERAVQSQLRPELRHPFRGSLDAQHGSGGVTGDHIKGHERQKGDDDHGKKQHGNALGCILHGLRLPSGAAAYNLPPVISGRVVNAGEIQHVDGIEGHALQSLPDGHQIRQVLDVDIGGVLGQIRSISL